jgi:hypothetical protein
MISDSHLKQYTPYLPRRPGDKKHRGIETLTKLVNLGSFGGIIFISNAVVFRKCAQLQKNLAHQYAIFMYRAHLMKIDTALYSNNKLHVQ